MAIQGKYYFSAEFGTVTSATALANPYSTNVTVDSTSFLINKYLEKVITDTHFDSPDRKGRLSTFLARMYMDYGVNGRAIACDEYTAVCIDTNGTAKVFGGYPTYDDNAYFIQVNCEIAGNAPENCTSGNPLTWNQSGEALKVYQVKGTASGTNTFDAINWENGTGGTWHTWSVNTGTFNEQSSTAINCTSLNLIEQTALEINFYPNPVQDMLFLETNEKEKIKSVTIKNMNGSVIETLATQRNEQGIQINLHDVIPGTYLLCVAFDNNAICTKIFIKD